MLEVFRVKFCELASHFDVVLTRHILKWCKSVSLWPPSVSKLTCCVTVVLTCLQRREVTQSSLASQPFRDWRRIGVHFIYAYQQCSANLKIDDSNFERLDPKGCPPPGRKSHPFVSYFQKARKHLCRKSTHPWKTKTNGSSGDGWKRK